jgi:hypothetical protein
MDTTFVKNLYGCEIYGMSKKNKNKNGINVSFKSDVNGFPISVAIASANSNDVKVALQQETSQFADCNSKNVQKNNKFKQILTADAMYYTNEFRDHMESKGYTVITDTNKRNVKNPQLLKKISQDKKKYLKTCNKRVVVERLNSWFRQTPKLDRVIEKTIRSYTGCLLLRLSFIGNDKLRKNVYIHGLNN